MIVNSFSISNLLIIFTCISIAILTLRTKKSSFHLLWGILNLTAFTWGLGAFLVSQAKTESAAVFCWKIAIIGVTFSPVLFFHFVYVLRKLTCKKILILVYCHGIVTSIANFSGLLTHLEFMFNSLYYPVSKGLAYPFFYSGWLFMIFYGHYEFFKEYRQSKGLKRTQTLYLFIGTVLGFLGGTLNFFPVLGIRIYPYSNFLIPVYSVVFAYGILKYHLLDIKVVLTRAGIFLVLYTLILGIPFWLGFNTGLWMYSTVIMLVLATAGPFLYQYLRRHAEAILLKEQKQYQHALRELSASMTRIRDLDKLIKEVVSVVAGNVRASFVAVYLKEENYRAFILKNYAPLDIKERVQENIPFEDDFIKTLIEQKRPLFSEEVAHQEKVNLDSGLVIPYFMEDELLGFMVLGAKSNQQMYTPDDILVFETLSYSTSLAIENCRYWHEMADRHRKARLQEMDAYSYSLAHEIDNPMQVVLGQAGLLQKEVLDNVTDEVKRKDINDSFDFIIEAAKRVSGMVKAIRDFGQKTTGQLTPLNIEDAVESFSKLYYPQFKSKTVMFEKTSDLKAPVFIRGEKPELMQVLVILANNSIHAMSGLKEKKAVLKLDSVNHDWVRIVFSDNGYGIKKEMLGIIFKPFVTTKASSEGTGMGLYNAQKIIEKHKGKIWAESEGEGRGAAFIIELPIAKEISAEDLNKEDRKSKRLI